MIQNNRSNAGAEVTKVFPNTGADQAGLLKDDIITSIDGKTVEGMTSLISIIKEYKPGENVTIEFTRQGNAQKVKTMITSKVESNQTTPCDCTRSDFRKEIDKEIIILKKGKTSLFLDEPAPTAPSALQPRIKLGRKNTLNVTAVALYPNPNDGEFTIDFALENSEPVTITVLDLAGREVYKNQLNEFNGNHRQVIDITEQAPGSYFLHIQQGKEGYTKKFIYNR